ncbi:MAG: Asp-tRNA(Asn)/Glu-tRNA(Gln) amidotransferase subunit GatB [Candidatus Sumerlaeia bacterium]|nr:Asp-tRNA(Asn)/Glu-tRNA(Gln) amidotransferase subunit GatB [Candidatus Sumerlaeia bacterium]
MELEPVIGFEVHSELKTKTKVFCGCKNAFGDPPNTNVCPVCLGMPGVLPVLNRRAFELALRTAIALHCEISERTTFDRKNYYYPDLPKNYQISQQYAVLGRRGYLEIEINGQTRRVGINNVHLEEDAGKNVHPETAGARYSLVDLNRAGVPLLEIVSEPDIRSRDEAEAYMHGLRSLLQYCDASDCKMQEGSLRYELNISMRRPGDPLPDYRVEVKNLASMKSVLRALDYEIRRQTRLLEEGRKPARETALWDDAAGETRTMRSKEGAQDYRYFPEPDLVEVHIDRAWMERARAELPELQHQRCKRFVEQLGLPEYDARILTQSRPLADYFEAAVRLHNNPKAISNWIMTELLRVLGEEVEPDDLKVRPSHLARLVGMIDSGAISGKIAKQVFPDMLETGRMPDEIVREKGLVQISDTSALESVVAEVIAENPDVAEDYRAGKDKALGRLVGQAMKKTRGQANPQLLNELLRKTLRGE